MDKNIGTYNLIKQKLGQNFKAYISVKYEDFCPEITLKSNVYINDYNLYMAITIDFENYAEKFYCEYSSTYQEVGFKNDIITIKCKDRNNTNIFIVITKI